MIHYCPSCGDPVADSAKTCPRCGTALDFHDSESPKWAYYDPLKEKCIQLIKQGQKLQAVKYYRDEKSRIEERDIEIEQAKDQIDLWEAELIKQGVIAPPKGCASIMLLAFACTGLMGWIVTGLL